LIERAQQLAEMVNDSNAEQAAENGAQRSSARPRSNGKPRRPKKDQAPVGDAGTGGPERPDESG
jgi:hypothetical protein